VQISAHKYGGWRKKAADGSQVMLRLSLSQFSWNFCQPHNSLKSHIYRISWESAK